MKPLLRTVVALSLLLSIHALPENIEDVKELPQYKEPVVEAEASDAQARVERCTTCTGTIKVKTPSKEVLAALTALPGAQIHTQQSFQGCSSDKGCAGIKVKDGNIIERYGNVNSFNAAAAADLNNEFTFHAAEALANLASSGSIPFWWMNQDSPFKTSAGGNFEKFSKSESSSFSSGANAANIGAATLNLAANPFLNGELSKGLAAASGDASIGIKPAPVASLSSGFESSYSSSSNGVMDLSKNPFLNGGFKAGQGAGYQGAFGAQGAGSSQSFGAGSAANTGFGASGYNAGFGAGGKVSTGYVGSSPSPFATTSGSNFNLIQSQKANEFDFEQQQQTQQNIDEIFQSSSNAGLDVSGGDLQQACVGQGYVCALKPQCANGIVIPSFAVLLQAKPKKQYCNLLTEVCCRIEVATLSTRLPGNLGVGSSFAAQGSNAFNAQKGSSYGAQSNFGKGTTASGFGSGYGSTLGASVGKGITQFGSGTNLGSSASGLYGSSLAAKGYGSTAAFGGNRGISTVAPATRFGTGYKSTSQSNFVGTDSFSAGSEAAGIYRPGAVGTVLKPGIPYLPPVDNTNSGTNIVPSTVLPTPTFVPTPRPIVTAKPTYLPPPVTSTAAPGYLPPIGEQTIQRETIVPPYSEGSLILDQNRPGRFKPTTPSKFIPGDVPSGCAAALKCTPIEYCTAEGVISNTTVFLTRDQDAYRVPLTDCKDIASGIIGKCCRDPYYTDPWPVNQLGQWVPGVFGGNDGKYVPDSKVSPNNVRPTVTVRPPVTGSVLLNNFITPTVPATYRPPVTPVTPVTPFPAKGQFGLGGQGQFGVGGQGQYGQGNRGQVGIVGQGQIGSGSQVNSAFAKGQRGQGTLVSQGKGQYGQVGVGQIGVAGTGQYGVTGQGQYGVGQKGVGVTQGAGFGVTAGQGFGVTQGQGLGVTQGQGLGVTQGQGLGVTQGQGLGVIAGQGQYGAQGQGVLVSQGEGQYVSQGTGTLVSQGVGQGVKQGQGAFVSQGVGQGVGQGQGAFVSQGVGQGVRQGEGAYVSQGVGQGIRQGQGAYVSQGIGQGVREGQGAYVSQGVGTGIRQGQGAYVSQGAGQVVSQGSGLGVSQGSGLGVSQGFGQGVSQGSGLGVSQGFGQGVSQGSGLGVSQGFGQGVSQGSGLGVSQGSGLGVSQGFGQGVSQGSGLGVSQGSGFGVSQGSGLGVSQGSGLGVSQGSGLGVSQGFGQGVSQGFGQGAIQGQGELVSQGFGTGVQQGQGQYETQGFGQGIRQGQGQYETQGFGQGIRQGQGQYVSQGGGVITSQGFGQAIRQGVGQIVSQGQGQLVSQGQGFGVENDYGESVNRVFLTRYTGGSGKCGLLNPQRPAGNRNNLEVDFAEIPWQAMVLLQTNKSLLCGGVITRPDVVITSAACVDGLEAKNVLIKGGEWKLGIDDEPLPFQIVQVKTILRHPLYKSGSLLYDAAILVLTENLRFAKNIYPICLPEAEDTYDALYAGEGNCMVTGWGKQVLQAHLQGSIMHGLNVSLIRPDDCQAKLSSDYPHLLEQYDQDSCVCGEPSNPQDNICRVDIGSALACSTGNGQYVLRGVYSWDSGCAVGNQIGAFYKFDIEWYRWAIGLIESVRFAKYSTITKITTTKVTGIKGGGPGIGFNNQLGAGSTSVKGRVTSGSLGGAIKGFQTGKNQFGFGNQGSQGSQAFSSVKGFGKVSSSSSAQSGSGTFNFGDLKPITNGFSATYSEKKLFQTEPKYEYFTTKPEIVTFTTKPEIVTFTTKPEYFTYTTKPKIVTYTTKPEIVTYTTKPKYVTYTTKPEVYSYTTKPKIISYTTKPEYYSYTTKPQIIRYETSGSGTNPQYVPPGTSLNESFAEIVGKHTHNANCKCIEGKK
nr:fibroin heavy chain-like isoform X2 [Maniola hyperantus]